MTKKHLWEECIWGQKSYQSKWRRGVLLLSICTYSMISPCFTLLSAGLTGLLCCFKHIYSLTIPAQVRRRAHQWSCLTCNSKESTRLLTSGHCSISIQVTSTTSLQNTQKVCWKKNRANIVILLGKADQNTAGKELL